MPILKYPLTFTTPSFIDDTDKARAKCERDFKEIVREADRYFTPKEVDRLVRDSRKSSWRRRGPKPNVSLLKQWYAAKAKRVTKGRFVREQAKKLGMRFETVKRRLNRLEEDYEKQAKEKARRDYWGRKFQEAMQRPEKSPLGAGTK